MGRLVPGIRPQVLRRAFSHQRLHGLVDLPGRFVRVGGQRVADRGAQRAHPHQVAPPPAQPFTPDQHHPGPARVGQARRQCHGVGVAAKKWRPDPLPGRRHLVGQQAHRLPGFERLDELFHAGQRGRRGAQPRAIARVGHQLAQPGLPGRTKQHRDGQFLPEALGVGLRGDLETAQMRREKQHPRAVRLRGFDVGRAFPAHAHRAPQPQPGQFRHQFAGLAHRGPGHRTRKAGLLHVGQQLAAVAAREQKTEPAQQPAQRVQHRQGHPGQETENQLYENSHEVLG